jgi:hypothetical protein
VCIAAFQAAGMAALRRFAAAMAPFRRFRPKRPKDLGLFEHKVDTGKWKLTVGMHTHAHACTRMHLLGPVPALPSEKPEDRMLHRQHDGAAHGAAERDVPKAQVLEVPWKRLRTLPTDVA